MAATATDAVTQAIALARQRLFPIVFDKWLRLGFIAFLAGLGEGGSSYGFQTPGLPGGSGKKSTPPFDFDDAFREAERLLHEHLTWIVLGASAGLLAILLLSTLILWLNSRADFIFVESVVHDRVAISEPWQRLREPAWRAFKVRLGLGLGVSALSLLLAAGGAFFALPALRSGEYLSAAVYFLPFIGVIVALGIPVGIFLALLRDFLIPLMYLDGLSVADAWRSFRHKLLPGRVGDVVLFYLLKLALGIAAAIATVFAMCLTCCIAAIPYVSSVVLLPIHVFFRAFSLYMLEALGRPVFPVLDPDAPWHTGRSAFDAPPRGPSF
jgi:hypothetical protein